MHPLHRQLARTLAAHELGHVLAARSFGLYVGKVTVKQVARSMAGSSEIPIFQESQYNDPEGYPPFAELFDLGVILLAGQVATDHWFELNGEPTQFSAHKDYANLRYLEKTHTYTFPMKEGQMAARSLVVKGWLRIEQQLDQLADHGFIYGSWL